MSNLLSVPPAEQPPRRLVFSLRLTLLLAALCAVAMIWLNEVTHVRVMKALSEMQLAHRVRNTVNATVRALVEAESNQRGFIMTGERNYLVPYQAALAEIDTQLKLLPSIAPHELIDSEALSDFKHLLAQKLAEMALTVRLREQDRAEVATFVVGSNIGFEHMRALGLQVNALQAHTDALVTARQAELYRLLNVSRFGLAAGAIAAFFAFFLYVNQTRALNEFTSRQRRELQRERDALEAQVRERTARLTELATYLQDAVEDERARLARELHDELGALLTAAKLDVARLKSRLPQDSAELTERMKHLTETLNQGIALKRRIIEDLRPSSLSNLGLVASLEILAREFGERSTIAMHTALEAVDLDASNDLTVYRVAQEALTNIGKYAEATEVTLTLKNYVNHAEVSITDNGKGFDPGSVPHASHGLAGMLHRVEAAGGRLQVQSAPGEGTRITAKLPRSRAKGQDLMAEALDGMSVSSQSYGADGALPTPAATHG